MTEIRRILEKLNVSATEVGLLDAATSKIVASRRAFDPRHALSVIRQARTHRTLGYPKTAFAEINRLQPSIVMWADGRTDEGARRLLVEVLLARSIVIADLLPEESLMVPVAAMRRSWRLIGGQCIDVPSAYVLSNLGNSLRRAKRLPEAIPMFQTVIAAHREPEEKVSSAMLLAKAAGSLRDGPLFEAAVRLAREGLDKCEPGTALINDFSLTEIEARGLLQLGDEASALGVLRSRDGAGELLATPQWRIIFSVTRGEALIANGLYSEAIEVLTACVNAAAAMGMPHQLQRVERMCSQKLGKYAGLQQVTQTIRALKRSSHSPDLL